MLLQHLSANQHELGDGTGGLANGSEGDILYDVEFDDETGEPIRVVPRRSNETTNPS